MNKLLTVALLCASAVVGAAYAGDITLYTREQFGGPALLLHESAPDLGKQGFNDLTSSVVVSSGTWEVCADKQYKGKCLILQKGEYAQLKGFNDMMSSVREIDPKADAKAAPRADAQREHK
jgi:hypothetical protein